MPPRPVLLLLLAVAVGSPLVSHATGSTVGAYSMFHHLERYRIRITVTGPDGKRPLRLRSLAPHLSRDARQMLLPADSWAIGADQVRLVLDGLPDVARLVCHVHTDAREVRVEMDHGAMRAATHQTAEIEISCR